MASRWRWVIRLVTRRIWFRAALFSVGSVLLALLAAGIAPIVPSGISTTIGSDAVDNILGILASSMLAVTTFSLTAMVSAFSGATNTITPRATELLVQDPTAQNALSTFLGAFLFAIVGICALSTGLYGETGRVVLFAGTVFVIVIIVGTLLRWIEHLSKFGRVADSIARVEAVTIRAAHTSKLRIGFDAARPLPEAGHLRARSQRIGYVTHVDVGALAKQAERTGQAVTVAALPGAFVGPGRVVAWQGAGDDESEGALLDAFTIDEQRQFDQDPRFGLVVLAEIAARALSPGINDSGTAIAVLGAATRVLAALMRHSAGADQQPCNVTLPPLYFGDLLEDVFRPVARDGAGKIEVAIKLQRALGDLAYLAPAASSLLQRCAADALARSERKLDNGVDVAQLRSVYTQQWSPEPSSHV